MEFLNIYAFLCLFVLPFVYRMKNKNLPFSKEIAKKITLKGKIFKKTKFYLLMLAFTLFVTALARPIISNGYITLKAPMQNIVIALDISYDADEKDLYPNRFEFAKTKIKKLLQLLHSQNTAIILFDKRVFLLSPPSKDYESLIYLLEHTDIKELKRTPSSDISNAITSAENLVKNPKIIIFTYKPYIPKNQNVFVYFCAKSEINDKHVFNAQYTDENLKDLIKNITSSKTRKIKIKDKKELFYYPLGMGILILMFVIFFPIRRIK